MPNLVEFSLGPGVIAHSFPHRLSHHVPSLLGCLRGGLAGGIGRVVGGCHQDGHAKASPGQSHGCVLTGRVGGEHEIAQGHRPGS